MESRDHQKRGGTEKPDEKTFKSKYYVEMFEMQRKSRRPI